MGKYDELKKLAEACKPETENAHLFGDDKYLGQHAVAVSAEQKMRKIIASYFGHPSERDWEDGDHALALASLEDYDQWLRLQKVVANPATVLALIAENEELLRFKEAFNEWHSKTEWVQQTAEPQELGMHRADVLRKRIDQLKAENERLREDLQVRHDWAASEMQRNDQLVDERDQLRAELDRARADAERYRHVRRLDPNQFGELWQRNIQTGEPFDGLVDAAMGKGGRADA